MGLLNAGSRSRVYYIYNEDSGENVARRDNMNEAFSDAKKMNKKLISNPYKVKGAWIIIKNKGD